jgi:hypothetical protein
MRTLLMAALLLAPLALADPNEAPECGGGNIQLGVIQIGGDPNATFYVDDRNYPLGNGMWFYQESNGVFTPDHTSPGAPPSAPPDSFPRYWWVWAESMLPTTTGGDPIYNLQRGGSGVLPGDEEICNDNNPAGPDTLIY